MRAQNNAVSKSIHWDITKNCNLRCQHCYNAEKYFNKDSCYYIENELSQQECLDAVNAFHLFGFNHVHFLGGEPLFSPFLFKTIECAKNLNMKVSLNSNATLLTEDVQIKLIELKINHFAASLDGCTKATNDKIRGDGTFQKICCNMKAFNLLIKEKHLPVNTALVFTLTKENIDDLILLPKLAHEVGVDSMILTTFIESGNGMLNKNQFAIDFELICEEVERMVQSELLKYNIPLQIDMRPRFCDYLVMKYNAPVMYNIKNSLCCAGEQFWYLEANGSVHPCLAFQLENGKRALENKVFAKEELRITRNSPEEIKNSKYWDTFLEAKQNFLAKKMPICLNCRNNKNCEPCFLDYTDNDTIIECEWVKKKELEFFEELAFKYIVVNDSVLFDELNRSIYLHNIKILSLEDDLAIEMWKSLDKYNQSILLFKYLFDEYEVQPEELKLDIVHFICLLKNNKLITMEDHDVR